MVEETETIEPIVGKYICRICGDFIEVTQKEHEHYQKKPPKHCGEPTFFYVNKHAGQQHLLRAFVILRTSVLQQERIALGNRLSAIERGDDQSSPEAIAMLTKWHTRFQELEEQATDDIDLLSEGLEIIDRMTRVKGVGRTLASKIVSMIDISKARTVSALWRYAGYGVVNGQRERLVKGERSHFNRELKTYCYQIGSSMMRTGSPYRAVYESAKEYYQASRPDWTKAHIHNASLRKMVKIFLSHLYVEWRSLEGLPVREPYVVDHVVGHTNTYRPAEFGWHDED